MKKKVDDAFKESRTKIILNYQSIKDIGFQYLMTKQTHQIQQLRLWQNKLSCKSMNLMGKTNWNSLTYLFLGYNNIGQKGCKYLSKVYMPVINQISLRNNQLTTVGIHHLMKAQWKSLQKIYFSSSKLNFNCIRFLLLAQWNKGVIELGLSQNELFACQFYLLILSDFSDGLSVNTWSNKIDDCYKAKLLKIISQKNIKSRYLEQQ